MSSENNRATLYVVMSWNLVPSITPLNLKRKEAEYSTIPFFQKKQGTLAHCDIGLQHSPCLKEV